MRKNFSNLHVAQKTKICKQIYEIEWRPAKDSLHSNLSRDMLNHELPSLSTVSIWVLQEEKSARLSSVGQIWIP